MLSCWPQRMVQRLSTLFLMRHLKGPLSGGRLHQSLEGRRMAKAVGNQPDPSRGGWVKGHSKRDTPAATWNQQVDYLARINLVSTEQKDWERLAEWLKEDTQEDPTSIMSAILVVGLSPWQHTR